jgi:transposase
MSPRTGGIEVTVEMIHSEKFKTRLKSKMTGPGAMSANALAAEVGLSQTTLSRWLREAHTVSGMSKSKKSRGSKTQNSTSRTQDWSPEEKSRVVVESRGLSEEELGAFLRKEGLHEAQLEEWAEAMYSSLAAPKKSRTASAETKRIKMLERELRRKEKALAEAVALLILQKKVREIWGDEDDDTEPRSGR